MSPTLPVTGLVSEERLEPRNRTDSCKFGNDASLGSPSNHECCTYLEAKCNQIDQLLNVIYQFDADILTLNKAKRDTWAFALVNNGLEQGRNKEYHQNCDYAMIAIIGLSYVLDGNPLYLVYFYFHPQPTLILID